MQSIQLMASNLGALISKHMVAGHEINSTPPASGPPRGEWGGPRGGRGGGSRRGAIPSGIWSSPNSSPSQHPVAEKCTAIKQLATICLDELRQSGVWLAKDMMASTGVAPLQELVSRLNMAKASSVIAVQPCDNAMCLQRCQIFLNNVSAEVKELKQKTAEMFVGVCLDCFKAKGGDVVCRYKHDK